MAKRNTEYSSKMMGKEMNDEDKILDCNIQWAIPDNKDTPPLRSILMKNPPDSNEVDFLPPRQIILPRFTPQD